MLEEFRVDNYKSLINVTFRPREQNLLLGVNNAGKTNLCQAMRFLSATAKASLPDCASVIAGEAGGMRNFYFNKPTIDLEARVSLPSEDSGQLPFNSGRLSFRYSLSLSFCLQSSGAQWYVDAETLHVSGQEMDELLLLENSEGEGRVLLENGQRKSSDSYVSASMARKETLLRTLFDAKAHPRAIQFRDYLRAWRYYDLSTSALRGSEHRPNRPVLTVDGSNLASVICHQKTTNERFYRALLEHLKRIEPNLEVLNFQIPSEKQAFMFFEDRHGNAVPAASAPSGTLRFLALLYILLGQPPAVPTTLRIIEEPENGIYVGYLKDLLAAAEETQPAPQVIFTSHSPYFIDLFDKRLESVFVLKRGERHSTLAQPDVEQVKKRLDKYPLGEQHFREMLG
jgi:predicted ATPase